jgi:hypothetical protein
MLNIVNPRAVHHSTDFSSSLGWNARLGQALDQGLVSQAMLDNL